MTVYSSVWPSSDLTVPSLLFRNAQTSAGSEDVVQRSGYMVIER